MIDDTQSDFAAIAAELCGAPVTVVAPAGRGGNNRIYRIEADQGAFALKAYPPSEANGSTRLDAEFAALKFLDVMGLRCIPKPYARTPAGYHGLYEWIEGAAIDAPDDLDIDAAGDFVARLKGLSGDPGATGLRPAREACLSAAELARQVEGRLTRLHATTENHTELAVFLEGSVEPAFIATRDRTMAGYAKAGFDPDMDIAPEKRTLSPSDFGFHNAIRRADGSLVFIDFEYFGWDDPVRLVADFALHPGMNLSDQLAARFVRRALSVYADDDDFPLRLGLLCPLVALRWCMILLNEFLPEKWESRSFAGAPDTAETAQARQLEKARAMLGRLNQPLMGLNDDR